MAKLSTEAIVGYGVCLLLSMVGVIPITFETFFGSWAGMYGTLTGALVTVAYLIAFILIGAVIFGAIGGYLGINNKVDGVKVGLLAGIFLAGLGFLYLDWAGIVTWTIPAVLSAMDFFYLLVSAMIAIVFSTVLFKVSKDAKY
jgi:hypothetical protein